MAAMIEATAAKRPARGGKSVTIRYDEACRALAAAKTYDEAADLRDEAEAVRAYARQAKNLALELDAAEIRFRAERKCGQFMIRMEDDGVLASAGGDSTGKIVYRDLGFNESREGTSYKRISKIPPVAFEQVIADWRERCTRSVRPMTAIYLLRAWQRATKAASSDRKKPSPSVVANCFSEIRVQGRLVGKIRKGELRRLAGEMRRAAEQMLLDAQRIDAIDQFIGGADHDIAVEDAISVKTFAEIWNGILSK